MFALIEKSKGYLFASRDLRELLETHKAALRSEVDQIEPDRFLNTAVADLEKYLVSKFRLEVPALRDRTQWALDHGETRVDVRYDQRRFIDDQSRPVLVPGQRIEVEIPFDGEPELFYARATRFTSAPPRAQIRGQALILVFEIPHDVQLDLQNGINRAVQEVERHLGFTRNDIDAFNNALPTIASQTVQQRRERLLANYGRIAQIGIPLKRRPGAPTTYAAPTVRKKVVPTLPPASSVPYAPEPVLDMELYEHILSVIQNMAQVMERSPSTFATVDEEGLRQHFLVQLNGQFEGAATGETFNHSGKTDILLRHNGRNVFIAECKFWKGPKQFGGAIVQLLSYTAWRDTKTAILVFNKGTAMSTVLSAVKAGVEAHANFKRTLPWKHESGYRFVLHQNGDPSREITLTVLVFDVPSA
jgi:hypothetical protein